MRSLAWLVILGAACFLAGQSDSNSPSRPRFSELSPKDNERLNQQRAVVADASRQRYGTTSLTRTKKDLPILQCLLDDKVFDGSQTYQLQSLGVAFGDVLATELSLHWVMITDEYGTDATLRFKNTSININALTMISKRVENGERVDVFQLLEQTQESLCGEEKTSLGSGQPGYVDAVRFRDTPDCTGSHMLTAVEALTASNTLPPI